GLHPLDVERTLRRIRLCCRRDFVLLRLREPKSDGLIPFPHSFRRRCGLDDHSPVPRPGPARGPFDLETVELARVFDLPRGPQATVRRIEIKRRLIGLPNGPCTLYPHNRWMIALPP